MSVAQVPVTLGSVCEINPPRPELNGLPDNVPVLFVPMAAVDDITGEVVSAEYRRLGELKDKSYRAFSSGDILFAKITPSMENGKSAVVPEIPSGIGFGSTEFHVLRPHAGAISRFIWHFVRQVRFRRAAELHLSGSVGQLRVPASFLNDFPITLPSEERQSQMVAALDLVTSSERLVAERLSSARAKIERFRRAVLVAGCAGRLTSDVRGGPPGSSDELPNGWRRSTVADLAARVTKGTTPTTYGHRFTSAGISFVKVENLRVGTIDRDSIDTFISEDTHRAQARSILEEGDVLFSIAGTIGRTAIVRRDDLPANTNQAVAIIRGTQKYLIPEYLVLALQSAVQSAAAAAARGSSMDNISLTDVRSFEITVPSKHEQAEIVSRVAGLTHLADELLQRVDDVERRTARLADAVFTSGLPSEPDSSYAVSPNGSTSAPTQGESAAAPTMRQRRTQKGRR